MQPMRQGDVVLLPLQKTDLIFASVGLGQQQSKSEEWHDVAD